VARYPQAACRRLIVLADLLDVVGEWSSKAERNEKHCTGIQKQQLLDARLA
jgi:hypothetical protein